MTCLSSKVLAFLADLPSELQAIVLCKLEWRDILRLRAASRYFSNLIASHAGEITRSLVIHDTDLRKMHSLYQYQYQDQRIDTLMTTLEYGMGLSHRLHVALSLARFLTTNHLMEIFYCKSPAHLMQSKHAPLFRTIVSNLKPHLMIISHMLERYKTSLAALVQDVDLLLYERALVSNKRVQAWREEVEILKDYNDREVCNTCLVFEFLKKTLFRQLRPASYAGSVERRLRGWTKPSASDDQVMTLMVFGGLDAIKRVITNQTYNARINLLEHELKSVVRTLDPVVTSRMMRLLPDRARWFNVWALQKLTGSNIITSTASTSTRQMEPLEFLALLRSEAMDRDFDLRSHEDR